MGSRQCLTAVFVLTSLQQVEPVAGEYSTWPGALGQTWAIQVRNEYNRFSKYMPDVLASGLLTNIAVMRRPESNELPGKPREGLELGLGV